MNNAKKKKNKTKTEENNRMGFSDLFTKTGDTKGTLHAKMGTTKSRNSKHLQKQTGLRRGGKNTKNCTKKVLMTRITTMVWSLT